MTLVLQRALFNNTLPADKSHAAEEETAAAAAEHKEKAAADSKGDSKGDGKGDRDLSLASPKRSSSRSSVHGEDNEDEEEDGGGAGASASAAASPAQQHSHLGHGHGHGQPLQHKRVATLSGSKAARRGSVGSGAGDGAAQDKTNLALDTEYLLKK